MSSKVTKRICPKCQFEDETGLKICPRDGSPMSARTKDPLIGQVIADKYEIMSMLGKGGMSVVYKAKHMMMSRMVAVKMLRPELVAVPQLLQRFKQESNAVSALRHPNIITVFDYGLLGNGTPYLIMDYLEGDTLNLIIKRDQRLKPERAIPLFAQACDALAHAHDQGVIHRDIKPANLLIRVEKSGEESLTIFDFGIAKLLGQDGSTIHKLTTSGEVFGSPLYMSPEQCSGEKITKKTDLYSLACVFYECLAGQPPLGGTSPMETLMKHVNEDPLYISELNRDLGIPQKLEESVMQALRKDPAERQFDMREMRDQILEAGNLRIMSASMHMTVERTLSPGTEQMVSSAQPKLTSGAVPQTPAKRDTKRSAQVSAHKPGKKSQSGAHQTGGGKKIPMPVLVIIGVLIGFGALAAIVYFLLHGSEAIVVPHETTTTTATQKTEEFNEPMPDFDGIVTTDPFPSRDQLQLSAVQDKLKCRVDFDGNLVSAEPAPLLASSRKEDSTGNEMKCIVVPVEISPTKINVAQAAPALFNKIFADAAKKPTWEKITENYGIEGDPEDLLVQEITFSTDKKSGSAEEGASSEENKPAGDEASKSEGGESNLSVKEYIVYLKNKDRLVACQFVPIRSTEAEMEKTISQFVPALRQIVQPH